MHPQKRHPERSLAQPHRERRSRKACPELAEGTRVLLAATLLLAPFRPCAQAQTPVAPIKTFHDPAYHLSFDYPANWTFSHSDGEISTFHLDARSAPAKTRLRAVVAMPENPFPASTFSGAYLYFGVIPHTTAASCAKQANSTTIVKNIPRTKPGEKTHIADIPFTHGHDEVKDICITQRDEIYTARHGSACYRFDLAINDFCGGDVSGVKDITPQELDQVRSRLEFILSTVRFDAK
jgi:hypothetical protein